MLEESRRTSYEIFARQSSLESKDEDVGWIEAHLDEERCGTRLNVADCLGRIGSWHGLNGQVLLTDGEPDGWIEIERAWRYQCLALKIELVEFQKGRVLGAFRPVRDLALEAGKTGLCLAWALVLRDADWTEYLSDALRVMFIDNEVVPKNYWDTECLEPFVWRLAAIARGEESDGLTGLGVSYGTYQSVFEAWSRPKELADAISEACDHRCDRMQDEEAQFNFQHRPFDLVPAEILALYKIRERLGLETPKVQHPLLFKAFTSPPDKALHLEDELLDLVESRI